MHPFVLGELASGNLANCKEIIALLHALPTANKVEDKEKRYVKKKRYGRFVYYDFRRALDGRRSRREGLRVAAMGRRHRRSDNKK